MFEYQHRKGCSKHPKRLYRWQHFTRRSGLVCMTNISVFVHNGISVELDQDFINLTKLWEMAGRPESQTPTKWRLLPGTDTLLAQILAEKGTNKNVGLSDVFKVTRGRNGKTLAHWKLALDYAGYLSPALKSQFYDWVKERIEEESNPELAYKRGRQRAVKGWQKQGHDQEWIQQRIEGLESRIQFTDTLKEHGIKAPHEYAICTNEIYKPLLGGTAKEVKQQRGITKIRDGLSRVELMAVGLAEALASEKMDSHDARSFNECRHICSDSSKRVNRVFE